MPHITHFSQKKRNILRTTQFLITSIAFKHNKKYVFFIYVSLQTNNPPSSSLNRHAEQSEMSQKWPSTFALCLQYPLLLLSRLQQSSKKPINDLYFTFKINVTEPAFSQKDWWLLPGAGILIPGVLSQCLWLCPGGWPCLICMSKWHDFRYYLGCFVSF